MNSILSTMGAILSSIGWHRNDSGENPFSLFETSETELPNVEKLNDSLYEFHTPADVKSFEFEVIFFHGLQTKASFVSKAYLHTWISGHGSSSFYWPQKLLAEEFPNARIFSVAYDSCTTRGSREGLIDIYRLAENLLQDLTQEGKGHRADCPTILVGKDIGGLVIKAVCLAADRNHSVKESIYKSFLRDIRGVVYYSTPQRGFLMSRPGKFDSAMFQNLGFQDAILARVSEEFNQLKRSTFKWQTRAVIGIRDKESELDIPEGSWRDGADLYYSVSQNLFSIARPLDKTDITYSYLSDLMSEVIRDPVPLSSSKIQSSLLFKYDPYYVPMKYTIQEIDKAFEKSCVVVLYGDSGTGKSCLARHYVLRFEEAMKRMDHGQNSSPIACYVYCGPKADIADIQSKMLVAFNIKMPQQVSLLEEFGIIETDSQKRDRLHTTFIQKLRDLDALVVLDDVWERSLLEKVLVPGLKCLITGRHRNLWTDPNAKCIRMQDVDMEDGQKLLATYAHFENQCIPKEFQVQANELIQKVEFHPLALATLGTVLQRGDKYDAEEWVDLERGLLAYMESEEFICTHYPRTVGAALMLVVNSKLLSDDSLYLLYVINLFQGSRVSESLVKSFLASRQPTALKRMLTDMEVLRGLSLVQITREHKPAFSMVPSNLSEDKLSRKYLYAGMGWSEDKLSRKYFHIHELRQSFILQQKKSEIDKVTGFPGNMEFQSLENRGDRDHDWATVLCAVSGVSSVKKEARQRMGRFYKWTPTRSNAEDFLSYFLATILYRLPGGNGELRFSDIVSHHNGITCTEVLWNFLINCRVDGNNISALFKNQDSIEWTLAFLRWTVYVLFRGDMNDAKEFISDWGHELDDAKMHFRGCCNPLISLLTQKPGFQSNVLQTLELLSAITVSEVQSQNCFLDIQKLLGALVEGKCFLKEKGFVCMVSLRLTSLIFRYTAAPSRAAAIVNTPGFLEQLVELLTQDVAADLQEATLHTLRWIIGHPSDESDIALLAPVSSNLLSRIVPFLSQDLGERCRQAVYLYTALSAESSFAEKSLNTPNCLQKLLELLAEDVAADLQEATLSILHNIVLHSSRKIFGNIFAVLAEKCSRAVDPAGALSIDRSRRVMTVNMNLLAKDVAADLQEEAPGGLRDLASHPGDGSLAAVSFDLLLRIVPFLSQDLGDRCRRAVRLLGALSKDRSCKVTIVNTPNCLQKLIELLEEDVAADLQEAALGTLQDLASHPSDGSLAAVSFDLLLRIVPFLSQDLGETCRRAVSLVRDLSRERSCAVMIVNTPNCLQKLIDLLAEDVAANLQEVTLHTLRCIISHPSDESDIIFAVLAPVSSNLLSRIIHFLSQDLGERCRQAVYLYTALSAESSFAEKSLNTPNCLQKLLELLAEDVAADLQEATLSILHNIALHSSRKIFGSIFAVLAEKCSRAVDPVGTLSTDRSRRVMTVDMTLLAEDVAADLQEEVLGAIRDLDSHPGDGSLAAVSFDLLLRIVPFLSQDLGDRCRRAVRLLGALSKDRSCKVTIVNTPNCLQKLIELLAEDVAADLQEAALGTLQDLASHPGDGSLATVSFDLLLRIVPFLSQDLGEICRRAVSLVGDLSRERSWAVMIVNTPNYLQKLIELLAEDVAANLQEVAVGTISNIASHLELNGGSDIILDALVTVSSALLSRIVSFLSQDQGWKCRTALGILARLAKEPSCAVMAVNTPSCLHKLMELLVEDVAPDLQEGSLQILGSIARHQRHEQSINFARLTAAGSDLLLRIVPFLSQHLGRRCILSVLLVQELSREGSGAVVTVTTPNCLEKLIELLAEDVDSDLQKFALGTLGNIARHHSDKSDIILAGFAAVRSDLLRRIVLLLSQHMGERCLRAVLLVGFLSEERSCAVMTITSPNCLQKLIELLAEDVPANLQNAALLVLDRVTGHDIDLNPSLLSDFATVSTNLERFSVRNVIEKQMDNVNNIHPKVRAALYRKWYLRNAMRNFYSAALHDINKALELEFTDCFLWVERGVLRRLMKNYGGALEDLDKALEIENDLYECLKHRGLVKFLMGNEEEASVDAERAMLLTPNKVDDNSYGEGCLGVLPVKFMTYELK